MDSFYFEKFSSSITSATYIVRIKGNVIDTNGINVGTNQVKFLISSDDIKNRRVYYVKYNYISLKDYIIILKMEILLNDNFKFGWDPGCFFNNDNSTYTVGPVGLTGPKSDIKKEINIKESIPKSLMFFIKFKNSDMNLYYESINLYYKTIDMLQKLKDSEIKVIIYRPKDVHNKKNAKCKYLEKVEEIEIRNKLIAENYKKLLGDLELLGCDIIDVSYPKYEELLDKYFVWEDYVDYSNCSITVYCHEKTQFYKFLQQHNILEQTFPEKYKTLLEYK